MTSKESAMNRNWLYRIKNQVMIYKSRDKKEATKLILKEIRNSKVVKQFNYIDGMIMVHYIDLDSEVSIASSTSTSVIRISNGNKNKAAAIEYFVELEEEIKLIKEIIEKINLSSYNHINNKIYNDILYHHLLLGYSYNTLLKEGIYSKGRTLFKKDVKKSWEILFDALDFNIDCQNLIQKINLMLKKK